MDIGIQMSEGANILRTKLKENPIPNIIEYYVTTEGPEPIQELHHKIDYTHYIDKQIKPIADTILSFFDTTFEDVVEGTKQTSLFSYS